MQQIPSIIALITTLLSYIIVPIMIASKMHFAWKGKLLMLVLYLFPLIFFLVGMGLKRQQEVGTCFTYFFIAMSIIAVAQAFTGVLTYIFLLIKIIFHSFSYPIIPIFILSLATTLFAYYQGTQISIKEITFEVDNLSQEVVIAHLPDIHLGHFQRADYLQEVVEKTNAFNPDLIFLNGDLFEDNYSLQPYVKDILARFTGKVVFTQGNHELYINYQEIKDLIEELGFIHLENELYLSHGIQIVGTDYLDADENSVGGHPSPNEVYLRDYLSTLELDTNTPSILVHHTPVGGQYVADKGFDIMLSGHTHGGGQVWPATIFGETMFEFPQGYYVLDNLEIYVSDGVGTFGVPLRLGTHNEINIIKLFPKP